MQIQISLSISSIHSYSNIIHITFIDLNINEILLISIKNCDAILCWNFINWHDFDFNSNPKHHSFVSFLIFFIVIVYVTYGTPYSFTYTNQKHVKYHHDTKLTPIVISDTSFESGMSEDYAIPPDALSQADSTYMEASIPSILMRTSYIDSPNKKMESLEKVDFVLEINNSMII